MINEVNYPMAFHTHSFINRTTKIKCGISTNLTLRLDSNTNKHALQFPRRLLMGVVSLLKDRRQMPKRKKEK